MKGPLTLGTISQGTRTLSKTSAMTEIGPKEIVGPLDLHTTVTSGQTAMPEWLYENSTFMDVIPLEADFVAFRLTQVHGPYRPKLQLEIQSQESLDEAQIREAKAKIVKALDLKRDLPMFYNRFLDDVLAEAFERFPGLRLMHAWDFFEALVSCMLTQWSSVRGWNTVARRLRRSFGTPVRFKYGSTCYSSATAESIANGDMAELRHCGTGFRAKYLKEAARMVVEGEMDLEDAASLPYLEAKRTLMQIPGVGTKVADCMLLYGYGMLEAAPVDVWMHRVIQRLYLDGEKTSQRRAEEFLRGHFGTWAGYAQLYLYHYARRKRIL